MSTDERLDTGLPGGGEVVDWLAPRTRALGGGVLVRVSVWECVCLSEKGECV